MTTFRRVLRYGAFDALMAVRRPFSQRQRQKRMAKFVSRMKITGGERVIDLGGTIEFWNDLTIPLKITVVNLPGEVTRLENGTVHDVTFREGNACAVDFAEDMSFDIAFSNSVIEHVGDEDRQVAMAGEVRRLAPNYWVQTPSIWFPIEAHNHMPFWWFYPEALKARFIANWRRKLPAWTTMVEETTVIPRKDMQRFFPDAQIYTERVLGWTKCYTAYKSQRP